MKILFLVPRINKASTRYRVLQYKDLLYKQGIYSDVFCTKTSITDKINLYKNLYNYDIVFIQKKLFQPWELFIIRSLSNIIIYDYDDAVMFHENETNKNNINFKFKMTIRNCDHAIAGNKYLKEFAIPYNKNIHILPTAIDINHFKVKSFFNKHKIILGWIGSHSTIKYLESMKEVFEMLGKKYNDIVLKNVSDSTIECTNIDVINKTWNLDEEVEDLHSFDIGLMPLYDDCWTRGKCGFKLLQYHSIGIPAVCSPIGVNKDIVEDGVSGYHARTKEEWFERLCLLIENEELRIKMGMNGRKNIDKNYSKNVIIHQLVYILKSCIKS